ncbi:MAG: TonB-dependent receptor, partial [Dysgonamonadaceae bacterium]|nr:TonB-dependent receptor [Dysgonamonadaceae bacterium]
PARQDFSLFAEKPLFVRFANHEVLLSAGIRANTLLGLSSEYAMSGKVYFDPRLNLKWTLPVFGTDNDWEIDFSAGIGWLSKFPTTAQLYPDAKYYDVVQLNYYHNNPDFRRINLRTYKWDNTNFDLTPARNRKWEVRLNLEHRGTEFSLTYFRERMNNAFRNISYYKLFPYINYDGTSINSSTLTAPPALEVLTSKQDTLINTFNQTGNGTRIYKQGVEFTFHTPRVNALKTRFTLTGAWLRTTNSTRMPTYDESTVLIGGEQLRYVGLYDWEDGSVRESFGTNVTADTYLQQIGMTLSLTAQCTWLTSSEPLWNSGVPISYVDKSGQSHPFTEADKGNAQLRQLVHLYSEGYFKATTVPFESAINLKASKKIGSHILLSLFVNRIAHIAPSYHRGSMLIRRSSNPYFGMEANLTF